MPSDLQQLLAAFVPHPRAAAIATCAEIPESIEQQETVWDPAARERKVVTWHEPVQVRETEREALHDLPAMLRLIDEQKRQAPRQVEPNPLSVLERMGEIIELLRHTWSLLFSSVAGVERVRTEWVVTLLALLELVRLGQARVHQAELFGDIVIESAPTTDAAPSLPPPDTVAREGEPTSGDSDHA